MSKKTLIIGAVVVVLAIVAGVLIYKKQAPKPPVGLNPPAKVLPADLISKDQAAQAIKDLVAADADKDSIQAYLYPQVLEPGVKVTSWGHDEGEEGGVFDIDQYSYLAWLDRDPGNVFYGHATEFVIVDAKTGQAARHADSFWPVVNGEPFEGDASTLIVGKPLAQSSSRDLGAAIKSYINSLSIPAVHAAQDKRLRITSKASDAPPGEYYALVVSGFGRNAWVFLDGAQAMYDALKGAGYDDAHITFLAPGPVRIDPSWDRVGQPKVTRQEGMADGATSPKGVETALAAITSQMTDKDSLFVFVLAHGANGSIKLGQARSDQSKVDLVTAFKGASGGLSSKSFGTALLAKTKACEIMVGFDSCYSGSHTKTLQGLYDPQRIKRLAGVYSSQATSVSYGADYRDPWWQDDDELVKGSLDFKAKKTPVPDPNPSDRGGEFSSGFIANLGKQVFLNIYGAGVAQDAAKLNKMTYPGSWSLGQDGPCVAPEAPAKVPPEEGTLKPPEEEPPVQPPAKPMKKIQAIPYGGSYIPLDQVQKYTAAQCKCCDADHWHAKSGTVKTIDGKTIRDPYANCGLGKVSDHPVTTVEVPQ